VQNNQYKLLINLTFQEHKHIYTTVMMTNKVKNSDTPIISTTFIYMF